MPEEFTGTTVSPEARRIGSTLRHFRELRGYKPEQFAGLLGISRPYLANIEAGRRSLSNVLLARAADALRVDQVAIMVPTETESVA